MKLLALFLSLCFILASCASLNWYGYDNSKTSDRYSQSDKNNDKQNTEEGIASWYGQAFQGRRTASGEKFDMHMMTAAHRKLPFNTEVKVTYLKNGKSVTVRINDRGPYKEGRIIDLSYAAAKAIGLDIDGIGKVKLEW